MDSNFRFFTLVFTVAALVCRLRPRKIHGCYKNLGQACSGNLVCLYFIVLYRETENEIYRIKKRQVTKTYQKGELKNELTLLAAS